MRFYLSRVKICTVKLPFSNAQGPFLHDADTIRMLKVQSSDPTYPSLCLISITKEGATRSILLLPKQNYSYSEQTMLFYFVSYF
jgi:hypothetical protein